MRRPTPNDRDRAIGEASPAKKAHRITEEAKNPEDTGDQSPIAKPRYIKEEWEDMEQRREYRLVVMELKLNKRERKTLLKKYYTLKASQDKVYFDENAPDSE